MADINKLDDEIAQDEQAVAITIYQKNDDPYVGPDGEEATISVLGSDAARYRRVRDRIQKRAFNRTGKLEPKEVLANRIELAAAAVTAWSGWMAGDQVFECTPENVKALLAREHILEQVEKGIKRHADFFAKC